MSLTITLTGRSSILQSSFLPPIDLTDGMYSIGLLSFDTYNSIPNIMKNVNDRFYFSDPKQKQMRSIQIPEGSYNINALSEYLQENMKHIDEKAEIEIRGNPSTLKAEIRSNQDIFFNSKSFPNGIGELLGFNKPDTKIDASKRYTTSNDIVQIQSVNVISIECNIASGSYVNGKHLHVIHSFFPAVEAGYKIVEVPNPVIYMPTSVRSVDSITISIVDQNGNPVNFRGEEITVRLHLKKNGN